MNSSRTWSILAGVLSLILGIILLVWPGQSLVTIVWIFGVFALLYGIIRFLEGIFGRHIEGGRRTSLILGGLASFILGALIIAWPGATLAIIVWLIAIRAIVVGIFEVIVGFSGEGEARWLAWVGILNILLGFIVFFFTAASVVALVWVLAIYLIIAGLVEIFGGFMKPSRTEPAA
jgi:uncharacterized membrane protein HdeD (DUF308 family)